VSSKAYEDDPDEILVREASSAELGGLNALPVDADDVDAPAGDFGERVEPRHREEKLKQGRRKPVPEEEVADNPPSPQPTESTPTPRVHHDRKDPRRGRVPVHHKQPADKRK